MAKVQGKYLVRFAPDMNSWTLSDNSRNESRSPSDQDLNVVLLSGLYAGNNLYFERSSILKIKRVYLESNGAPGLKAPLNGSAGTVKINFTAVTTGAESMGGVSLVFSDFNKWYDVDTVVNPSIGNYPDFSQYTNGIQPYKMAISSQGSFNYDGYNLSSDYVGQEFTPRVIMEIETAGVYTYSFELI